MEGFEDPFCRRCYPWGGEDTALCDYYAALCRMKNTIGVLRDGDVRMLRAGEGRIAFARRDETTTAKIYVNQSGVPWHIGNEGRLGFGSAVGHDGAGYTLEDGGFCLLLTPA